MFFSINYIDEMNFQGKKNMDTLSFIQSREAQEYQDQIYV